MIPLLVLVGAYLLGAIPFGYLLVRWRTGNDIRGSGSGNIGATNVLRTTGRGIALATLVLDIAKGFLAVWLASWLTGGNPYWTSGAALAVMAGHAFPVFIGFKGGKAVASFVGAFLFLTPVPLLAVAIVFVATVAATRYISLGSVIGAGLFPFAVWMIVHPPTIIVIASVISGTFIIYRHRSNLERLRAGTENILSFSGKRR